MQISVVCAPAPLKQISVSLVSLSLSLPFSPIVSDRHHGAAGIAITVIGNHTPGARSREGREGEARMQLIGVARGVEHGFETAAKFPSIALVKYRGETKTETRERENEGRGRRFRAAGGVLSQGKDASQLRKLRLCSRPRKSLHDGRGRGRPAPVAEDRRRDTLGRLRACTVCSADALDYLRFAPRRFEWIAHRPRRVVGCCERTLVAEAHERGRSPE